MNPYVQGLSKQCLFHLIKCHDRYGYTSLETIATWNSVYLKDKKGFKGIKQPHIIEGLVLRSDFTNNMEARLRKHKERREKAGE
ncbi:hypothetical protein ACU5EH_25340 [Aliivibrio salmonicida]|uniref:hypothetical protein n=1 Tax=Aliivibrio salmonicida TaxID=40269 RepID=UPI00406D349E